MLKQSKPNSWQCLPTAFAIVLDITVARIFEMIGHDGSEILCPELTDPAGRRGFHVQELVDVCLKMGRSVTPIERYVQLQSPTGLIHNVTFGDQPTIERFDHYVNNHSGVLFCRTTAGYAHAFAVDNGRLINPDDQSESLFSHTELQSRKLFPVCLWIVK